ncbi:ParB family protein [Xenorhabdus hominickii]|uniref:VirB n=1 Tax=Xenorhabdus hominickii TaxID=351679 RepID=A0A1V0M4P9_XENHO|nr:ParB family protein [Xenorhabdus hominickii]ARD69851.1 Virulence regulon transcriptional activator VirB [Xenorhabdus hominickii]PHM51872.1 VirB [Xenorhabdus hominickii]
MTQKTERPIIGRTFSESPLAGKSFVSSVETSQRFTLASGHKVMFHIETIPAEQIATRTYVDQTINGRDQNALSPESLEDITRTLPLQQFFPLIGREVNGRIEILDGSRRRAAALICNVGLRVMFTRSEISPEDARQLAADIQTAKEHNIREVGIRLLALRESGMSQKEIAESTRISPTKVTRAIQAASVPDELLSVFPIQSELTYPDYKKLFTVAEIAGKKDSSLKELVADVAKEVEALHSEQKLIPEDFKNEVIKLFDKSISKLTAKPMTNKPVTEALRTFDDRRVYARKKTNAKERKVSYEFSRISKDVQDKIDEAIRTIIEQYE